MTYFIEITEPEAVTAALSMLTPYGVSIAWSALWLQLVVVPFYKKREQLHQDYWESGKINLRVAAIESSIIGLLARLVRKAADEQTDGRRSLTNEIEELLQSTEFFTDLEEIQGVLGLMNSVKSEFNRLKPLANRLWIVGLAHVAVSIVAVACLVYSAELTPFSLLGVTSSDAAIAAWWVTFLWMLIDLIGFNRKLGKFNDKLQHIDEEHGEANQT